MKLKIIYENDDTPDEIVGIVSLRDKLVIATQRRLILAECDEEMDLRLRQLAVLHGGEFL